MRKFSYGLAFVAMTVATVGIALAVDTPPNNTEGGKPAQSQVFKLNPTGQSGQSGTVTITSQGATTKVVIALTGEPDGAHQPTHIHVGDCAHPGAVKIPLTDIVAGHSTTVIAKPYSEVVVAGTSINTHKSLAEINVYKACANLTMGTSM
jgi:Cu/Zn superoxide dismutase